MQLDLFLADETLASGGNSLTLEDASAATALPGENDPKPGRCTGPRTKKGKERSSMNRLIHGCFGLH